MLFWKKRKKLSLEEVAQREVDKSKREAERKRKRQEENRKPIMATAKLLHDELYYWPESTGSTDIVVTKLWNGATVEVKIAGEVVKIQILIVTQPAEHHSPWFNEPKTTMGRILRGWLRGLGWMPLGALWDGWGSTSYATKDWKYEMGKYYRPTGCWAVATIEYIKEIVHKHNN